MISNKKNFSFGKSFHVILFFFFSAQLFLFSYYYYTPTANNDVYHQLLSTEKIIESFDFSDVNPHPVGIPLFSSFLIYNKIDPIFFFKWMSPLIIILIFYILYFCIKIIGRKEALLISFYSCTHLFFLKSFNQFNAEITGLFFMISAIFFTLKIVDNSNSKKLNNYMMGLFICSYITIILRDAFFFIVIGCYFFIFFQIIFKKNKKKHFFKIALSSFLLILPAFYRLLNNPQSGGLRNKFSLEILGERLNLVILEFFSIFTILPETVLPKLIYFESKKNFLILITIILISFCFYIIVPLKNKKIFYEKKYVVVQLFLFLALVYFFGLLFSSGVLNYKWGNVYRISGFTVFYFGVSFWILLFNYLKNNKKLLVIAYLSIIFISQIKIMYAVRYEYNNSRVRFLYDDHSHLNNQLLNSIFKFQNIDTLNVFTGGEWHGRNLFSIIKYNKYIRKENLFKLNNQKNINIDKNLLMSDTDYKLYFNENNASYDIHNIMDGDVKFIVPKKSSNNFKLYTN